MAWKRFGLAAALAVSGLASAQTADPLADKVYGTWGVDLAARDVSVRPGDDFDRYASGSWAKAAQIPADSFFVGPRQDIARLSEARLKAIIETAPATSQVGALYRSYMDIATVEARGIAPLAPALDAVVGAADRDALAVLLARPGLVIPIVPKTVVVGPPVTLAVDSDPGDATRLAIGVLQGGLTFPDRDYYLLDRFAGQRAALAPYVEHLLALAGDRDAAAEATKVVAFETAIARVSYSRADSMDATKINNPTTLAGLERDAPGLPWTRMLAAAGLPAGAGQRIIVAERGAVRAIAALYAATPLDTLRAWARFHVIDSASRFLPQRFVDQYEGFALVLRGAKVAPSRERRAIRTVNQRLGELIGRAYAARFFDPQRKAAMVAIATNVKAAMRRRLAANDWMTPATRATALAKLDRTTVQVGYPNVWRDYRRLRVAPDDLFGNIVRSIAFDWAWQKARLGKPIDRRVWSMTPQTDNAYNDGQLLTMVFPAAGLQPPYFGFGNDPAVNYGAIGATIGHEISHNFDDFGRQIDVDGVFRNWWTPADVAEFERRTAMLGAQYDAFEALPGAHVDGRLTMGENIADLAGLLAALDAYHATLGGKPAPVIDGLTGDQRFFLAYAQMWREKQTDDDLRNQVSSDEHAPPRFRVIGPLRNVDAWYAAFAVAPGDRYYVAPDKRARIW